MPAAARRMPEVSPWDQPPEGGEPPRPSFGKDLRPQRRSPGVSLLVAVLLSGWFHGTIVGSVLVYNWLHKAPPPPEAPTDIETIDLSKMPALRAQVEEIRKAIAEDRAKAALAAVPTPPPAEPKSQLVELAKSKNPADAPKDARFLSEENHKVDEETVSRDQVMAPKVLADSFKGMGDKADAGASKFEGEPGKIGEGSGHDARSEHVTKGHPNAVAMADAPPNAKSAPDVFDPFGIRIKPHDETPAATPPSGPAGNGDHDADKTVAGGGTKVAMAGAPSNDYLPTVKIGDKTGLNAKEFVFASFWHRVQRAVEPFWVKHVHEARNLTELQKRDYLTRVNVTLNADGTVAAVEVEESCGIPGWDSAVTQAFSEAAPFMNPPPGLVDPSGKIHMNDLGFIVSLTGGQVVHMYGDPRAGKLFPGVGESLGPR